MEILLMLIPVIVGNMLTANLLVISTNVGVVEPAIQVLMVHHQT